MIVTCSNCTTRLQLDDAKVPARPFSVRCPKCQQIINAQPPPVHKEGSALAAVGDLPVSTRSQRDMSVAPAPASQPEEASAASVQEVGERAPDDSDVMRLLSALLQRGDESAGAKAAARRPAWERRRALACLSSAHRQTVARLLSANGYEVFAADTTSQAVERMREERMDVVVLDGEFDMMEQGAAFINRELNSMRMADRRRIVFVQLSPSARTSDGHAAFLANANLIVNNNDVAELPRALERCVRDLNELYRNFNKVLNVAEL